jgi:hypothetical protein
MAVFIMVGRCIGCTVCCLDHRFTSFGCGVGYGCRRLCGMFGITAGPGPGTAEYDCHHQYAKGKQSPVTQYH